MPRRIDTVSMSPAQSALIETALHQLAKMDPCGWEQIPEEQKKYFAEYMGRNVWTGGVDLFTLRDAALMLIRDAIARKGAFSIELPARQMKSIGFGSL